MKYVMIVGDGMADLPIEELGGKTPLEWLDPPFMRRLAGGRLGRLRTCPDGLPAGSDVAFLTLTGNDPRVCYTGRAALEAAGMDVQVAPGETALRMNLVTFHGDTLASHNGFGVHGEEALELARFVSRLPAFTALGARVTPTDSFRHMTVLPLTGNFSATPPHDITGRDARPYWPVNKALRDMMLGAREALEGHPINAARVARGEEPVNGVWFWGAGTGARLINFAATFGVKGAVVSAVPLVRGIARLCGLEAPEDSRFTGLLDTDYEGKADCCLRLLSQGADFVLMHLEAPDEMSHDGSLANKLEAVRRLDGRAIAPLLDGLAKSGEYRVLLLPDHYTLLSTRTHDATPVPFALFDSRRYGAPRTFCERACAECDVLESGEALLRQLFSDGEGGKA